MGEKSWRMGESSIPLTVGCLLVFVSLPKSLFVFSHQENVLDIEDLVEYD